MEITQEIMKSGIPGLDKIYEFKSKQTLLISGPPGPEKKGLAQQFLYTGLTQGEPGVYITTDHTPQELRDEMAEHGWDVSDFEKQGLMHFIDCHSWIIHEKDSSPSVTSIPSPSALSELAIETTKILQKMPNARVIFDSISTVLLYNEPRSVFRFLQVLTSKSKQYNAMMMILVEEGMHESEVCVTLEHLTDGNILIETVPDRQLRIERVFDSEWIPYKMTREGILILT